MSDVKRYEPFGRDGLSSVMHEDDVGDYVRYDDHEAKRKGWFEQHARDSAELRRICGERDQLREERDSHQRLCIAEMEKVSQLRAELDAIRGQEPVGYISETGMERVKAGRSGAVAKIKTGTCCHPLYALPPQQPDAVSVPRALVQEALEMAIDDAEEHQCSPCFNPTRQRVLDEQVERWRALLSTRQAEEDEPCAK